MTMKKRIYPRAVALVSACVLLLGAFAAQVQAQKLKMWENAFVEGNRAYEKEDYALAAKHYQTALNQGYESWEVYYNLGNAYYRSVDYPHAILYYEKALRLSPKNRDVKGNLALAEGKILDRFNPLPQIFIYTWWEKLCGMFSLKTWAWVIVILFALGLASCGVYLQTRHIEGKRAGFLLTLLFAVLFCGSMVFAAGQYRILHADTAVVMQASVNVKASPQEKSETKFILHEGSKVRIEDQAGSFVKIRVKNGSRGWVLQDCLERI